MSVRSSRAVIYRVSAPRPGKRLFPPAAVVLRSDVLWVFRGRDAPTSNAFDPWFMGEGTKRAMYAAPWYRERGVALPGRNGG
jgi:hypothetical protein